MTAPPVDPLAGKSKNPGPRSEDRDHRGRSVVRTCLSASGGSRWNERNGDRRMIRLAIGWLGAAVAVCFAPEEDCASFAVDAIDRAEQQILVNAYGLTTSSAIVEALVRAKQRGIDVKLIADRTTPWGRNSGIGSLARA